MSEPLSREHALELRPLESSLFDVPVFSADVGSPEEAHGALDAAPTQGVALLVVRVRGTDLLTAHTIEQLGGRLCDVLLTLPRTSRAGLFPTVPLKNGYRVRLGAAADRDAVHRLAELSFRDFVGHWHADDRLRRKDADALYANWADALMERSTVDSPVWVVESNDAAELQGFLAFRALDSGHFDVPLTAVHPAARGGGLLRSMMGTAVDTLARDSGIRIDYETQLSNVAALRAVTAMGFSPTASRLTFHLWTDRRS